MPEPFLERLTILDANLVLDGTSTTQFIALQCKHIMIGQDKLTTATFSGHQWANPSKFNFSSNFSYLTATDMGSGRDSVPRVASISGDNSAGVTSDADTTRATGTPFLRKMWLSDMFLTTRDTFPLPFLRRV